VTDESPIAVTVAVEKALSDDPQSGSPPSNFVRHILLVSDDTGFLDSLARLLRRLRPSWRLRSARRANEALSKARQGEQHAVVVDLRVPDVGGLELLASLRSMDWAKDMPVVMLTGMGQRDLKRLALEAGAVDLLNEPFETEDLLARLDNLLRLKDAQDQLKALNAGLEREVIKRTASLEESRVEILWHLAKACEWRDEVTGQHVARVAECSRILARQLGQPAQWVEMLFLASSLHDIGKIGIPDSILLKPGRLDDEERRAMQRHCEIGHGILLQAPEALQRPLRSTSWSSKEPNPLLKMAAAIAMSHHERWDGQGYPQGLRGDQIPLEARIVGLIDTFDALGSPRPYKQAFPLTRVLEIMREESHGHFDPDVYRAFVGGLEELLEVQRQYSDEFCIAGG